MGGNFSFLENSRLSRFFSDAAEAEELCMKYPKSSLGSCRRAAEGAANWLLEADTQIGAGFEQECFGGVSSRVDFNTILQSGTVRRYVDADVHRQWDNIRYWGNKAAHPNPPGNLNGKKALNCLGELHTVLAYLAVNYDDAADIPVFDKALVPAAEKTAPVLPKEQEKDVSARLPAKFEQFQFRDTLAESLNSLPREIHEKANKVILQIKKMCSVTQNYSPVRDAGTDGLFAVTVDLRHVLIVFAERSSLVFLYVAEEKKALEWARGEICRVNTETGTVQVYPEPTLHPETGDKPPKRPDPHEQPGYLFGELDADMLLRLGVPDEYVVQVSRLTDQAAWMALQGSLPQEACMSLAAVLGGVPAEQVIARTYGGNQKTEENDVDTAVTNPTVGAAVVESDEELEEMLNAPLEKWRVFLHPHQRKLAYSEYKGSSRVFGGAGTGKTVVAIHHAKHLADNAPEGYRILFTTYTKQLIDDIDSRLRSICSPEAMEKIEVTNLDKMVYAMLRQYSGGRKRIQYKDNEIISLFRAAKGEAARRGAVFAADIDERFLYDEWVHVIQAQDIRSKDEYYAAERRGRGRRLDRQSRESIWRAFVLYSQMMERRGMLDREAAVNFCCRRLREDSSFRCYDSVIVDECPDFGQTQFRLLRAMAGNDHPDDLFLTGDPRQRIYNDRPKVTFSHCGINLRGRSNQLLLNYRTTGKILAWASRLLRDVSFSTMDDTPEELSYSTSAVEGEQPSIRGFGSETEESDFLAEEIRTIYTRGTPLNEIAVMAHTKRKLSEFRNALEKAHIPCVIAGDDRANPFAVQLMTMHGSKGLEFSYVFIAGACDGVLPSDAALRNAQDEDARNEVLNAEKMLLYVALTRARRNACVTYSGEPSPFLALLQD